MGTGGWIVLRHRGEYYRIYCSHDSYEDSLGAGLVDELLKPENLEEDLLKKWRQLLDLGSIAISEEEGVSLESPKDAKDLETWNKVCSSIKDSGPIGTWFQGKAYGADDPEWSLSGERGLTNHNDRVVFIGTSFVWYIYLVDLDENEFSACASHSSSLVCVYPFQDLREKVKTSKRWCEMFEEDEEGSRTAYRFSYMFPYPRSVVDPLQKSIRDSGYQVLETVSESYTAVTYKASHSVLDRQTTVFLKVFFSFREESFYRNDDKDYTTWDRSIPVAKLFKKHPHPNIVSVIETTTFNDHPALVLEAFDGSLDALDLDSSEGRNDYVSAIVQVSQGVAHMHRFGIVHRDIKPVSVCTDVLV